MILSLMSEGKETRAGRFKMGSEYADTDNDDLAKIVDHLLGCSVATEKQCTLDLASSSPLVFGDNSPGVDEAGLEMSLASSRVPGCMEEERAILLSKQPEFVAMSSSDCPIHDELGSDAEFLEVLGPMFTLPSELDSCLSSLLASPVIAQAIGSSLHSPINDATVESVSQEMYLPVKTAPKETCSPGITATQEVHSPIQSITRQLLSPKNTCKRDTTPELRIQSHMKMKTAAKVKCRHGDMSNSKAQDSSRNRKACADSASVSTPKWKLSFNIGKQLLEEFGVPDTYHDKGYVSLGRLLLGGLLKSTESVVPFIVGTEFPDLDYGPDSSPGALEPNLMFFGMANLESDHCSLVFDTEKPYLKEQEEGVKMQGVPNLTVHRLPLKSFRFAHLVRDLAWAPPPSHDCLLACVASGATLSVFRWEVARHRVYPLVQEVGIHSDIIRSIGIHGNTLASGGFDGQLKLFQLEHLTSNTRPPAPIFQHSTDDVISCVSWRTPHCVCCSTDGGQLVLVDTRASRRKKPPLQINTNKQELYCHAFCGVVSNHVMLGYGGGTVAEVDIRKPNRILQELQDSAVSAIGDISVHPQSGHMVTMGTSGFTFWSKSENSHEMSPRTSSHVPSSPYTVDMEYSTSGGFIPETPFYAIVDTCGMFSVADMNTMPTI